MLNETEQDTLQILLNNELLLKVIHKVFNEVIEANLPIVNKDDSNALLGEKYRAYEVSKSILDMGFRSLNSYKKVVNLKGLSNRAR